MARELFGHPFSSYTWKALIALYENETPFEFRMLGPEYPEDLTAFAAHAPLGKFPVLVDDGLIYEEASIIIEHLAQRYPGTVNLIPPDEDQALYMRLFDRVCDNYVMAPMQKIVGDAIRPPETRDAHGVAEARVLLDKAYAWLDARLEPDQWASGWGFTIADCAAAPSLFYADWVHPIPAALATLKRYRAQLLARPSVARCVEEARPYRHLFPPGAPDRD